jgi:tetratricopeptide (TPR) repeat protein
VERGLADEAVDIYATLLEETRLQYGDVSIETAPAYYEYGNTLLRAVTKQQIMSATDREADDAETKAEEQRAAAAAAAERRQEHSPDSINPVAASETESVAATGIGKLKDDGDKEKPENDVESPKDGNHDDQKNGDYDDGGDSELALEMIENSFSILEEYKDSMGKEDGDTKYSEWVKGQLPRVLMGIGDTLSKLNRHADAADAYSRALELRKACLEEIADTEGSDPKQFTTDHLKAHRMVCEANILIAEELLSCPQDEDVLTTETKSLIVKSNQRVSYARGYYDQARDALQEAVVFMGSLPRNIDLGREKEDVCFLATLVMGVGESLAVIDEKTDEAAAAAAAADMDGSTEPMKKKAKKE